MGSDITGTDLPEQQISTSSTMIVQTSGSSTFMADFMQSTAGSVFAWRSGPHGHQRHCAHQLRRRGVVLVEHRVRSGPVTLTFSSFSTEGNFDYVYVDNDISTQGQGNRAPSTARPPRLLSRPLSTMSILHQR